MTKFNKALVLLAAVMAPLVVQAEGKIAVLNVQEAIMNTDAAKKSIDAWKSKPEVAENIKQLDDLKADYQEAVKKLQKDAAVMSPERKQEEGKKIQSKMADIEHVARKLQAAEKELIQGLMQQQAPGLQKVVTEMIQSDGIGLLLDKKAVMHVDSSFSITAKVTDKMNQAQ